MNNDSSYLFCRSQMDADEILLWRGRPTAKGLCMSKYDRSIFCFGIGFTLFAAFCLTLGWIGAGPDPMVIGFTIVFPIAGIAVAVGPLRRGLRTRNHTEYVITNKRLFRRIGIHTEVFTDGITQGYETILHRNGTATIRFAAVLEPNAVPFYVNGREVIQPLTLVKIADYEGAQRALTTLQYSSPFSPESP